MELNYAELYGIDLDKLRQESFTHLAHHKMLKAHYRRVTRWENRMLLQKYVEEWLSRHTENNVTASTESGTITTIKKNGN
jgi:hypothetical protein